MVDVELATNGANNITNFDLNSEIISRQEILQSEIQILQSKNQRYKIETGALAVLAFAVMTLPLARHFLL